MNGIVYNFTRTCKDNFVIKNNFFKILDLYSRATGLKNIAVLDAHGNSTFKKNCWEYKDDEFKRPVQEWVDENDGKYLCLMLWCCNMGNFKPKTKKSLLIFADNVVSGAKVKNGTAKVIMFSPMHGVLTGENIESCLQSLKNQELRDSENNQHLESEDNDVKIEVNSFPVRIEDEISFYDLIKACEFVTGGEKGVNATEWNSCGNFPKDILFKAVSFKRQWLTEGRVGAYDVLIEFAKIGIRPATSKELLYFCKQYPHIPECGNDLWSLGSLMDLPFCGLKITLLVERDEQGKRHLFIEWFPESELNFPDSAIFLGVSSC